MRILIVEDDTQIANFIKKGFAEKGNVSDIAKDAEEGNYLAEEEDYDLIVLDLMLPKGDGLEICTNLRSKGISTPIIILTAKVKIDDRVEGLNAGADDYLTKPFAFSELQARVNALLRRTTSNSTPTLKVGNLELDPISHEVKRDGKVVELSPKEFSIFEFLLRHKNQVVTRTMILEHVWDYNFESFSNIVDVYITKLRKKINDNSNKKFIQSIHGVGFKIQE